MALTLTPDQIAKLQNLGIPVDPKAVSSSPTSAPADLPPIATPATSSVETTSSLPELPPLPPSPSLVEIPPPLPKETVSNILPNQSNTSPTPSNTITDTPISGPTIAIIPDQTTSSSSTGSLLTPPKSPQPKTKSTIIPLLSISGLTLASFSGLVLLKNRTTAISSPPQSTIHDLPSTISITPTQVPKSIQHYLLASQQYFSQALQLQTSPDKNNNELVELLNQSILAATDTIKLFPSDYRGYQQRARIYQSLADSQPQLLAQAIADFTYAARLNPSSPELTKDLASLYARQGDAQNTLAYLTKTVILEPTKAQNFYDLAKIQQQTGQLPQALETYTRLLSLVTDPTQKAQVESEKLALENLTNQTNPGTEEKLLNTPTVAADAPLTLPDNPPTIQALADTGLIIAAPETNKSVEVKQLTASNSLAGEGLLPSGQHQVTLQNSLLTSTSQVYVTITKGGKNQTLQVLSKNSALQNFSVGLDSPTSEDISFKWWIIN